MMEMPVAVGEKPGFQLRVLQVFAGGELESGCAKELFERLGKLDGLQRVFIYKLIDEKVGGVSEEDGRGGLVMPDARQRVIERVVSIGLKALCESTYVEQIIGFKDKKLGGCHPFGFAKMEQIEGGFRGKHAGQSLKLLLLRLAANDSNCLTTIYLNNKFAVCQLAENGAEGFFFFHGAKIGGKGERWERWE
jgi:hypothetical protein